VKCPVCRTAPAEVGVLCEDCRDELVTFVAVASEQISLHRSDETCPAALIDVWGRPHRLGVNTEIGREVGTEGLLILDASVSRRHARIVCEGGDWTLTDLGSTNGTVVEGRAVVRESRPLGQLARVQFGGVAFFFSTDVRVSSQRRYERAGSETERPPRLGPPAAHTAEIKSPSLLDDVVIVLNEPTGGGGCVAQIDGKRVQLTLPQQEFISLLLERMSAEADAEPSIRGFVSMAELVARISLDSAEANIRQLVRRVRRTLERAGIADLIESRHSRGYRLRVKSRAQGT
jgi:hypothetical protein